MPTKYALVILDIDGTTVPSGQNSLPSQRVVKAVMAAQKKVHVAIATGRPYNFALPVITSLGLSGLSIVNGGAEIVDVDSGELIYTKSLSKRALKELVKVCLPFGYQFYSDSDEYSRPIASPNEITSGASKLFIRAVKPTDILPILEAISAVETAAGHPTTSWDKGNVRDIHVTHVLGTKRHGVERLIKMIGADKKHTMAIGDSHNDIPLLEAAGFKVAMGNGPKEVKAIADFIAPSIDDDGVAVAIERFILG